VEFHEMPSKPNQHSVTSRGDLIRQDQLLAEIPIGNTTLWRWVNEGRFPRPIRLGQRVIAWRRSDVDAWLRKAGDQ
jgi:prophage regulatory protein